MHMKKPCVLKNKKKERRKQGMGERSGGRKFRKGKLSTKTTAG